MHWRTPKTFAAFGLRALGLTCEAYKLLSNFTISFFYVKLVEKWHNPTQKDMLILFPVGNIDSVSAAALHRFIWFKRIKQQLNLSQSREEVSPKGIAHTKHQLSSPTWSVKHCRLDAPYTEASCINPPSAAVYTHVWFISVSLLLCRSGHFHSANTLMSRSLYG